jgi:dihydrodipicolinate synthase/N-acetylneuraminate lyase
VRATGEGPLLDEEEVAAVIATVVEAARGRVRVLAHVGRPDTPGTLRLARRALADGADAVSAVVPYYYALDDTQVVTHFRSFVSAAGASPAYAYTIPARTGNDLSLPAARALADDGLRGIKDSSKSFERHREYLATGLAVLIGSDGMVADALAAGSAGCVSALANVRPDLLLRIKQAAVAGRRNDADAAQKELLELRAGVFGQRALVELKATLAQLLPGYPSALRLPLL